MENFMMDARTGRARAEAVDEDGAVKGETSKASLVAGRVASLYSDVPDFIFGLLLSISRTASR